MTLDQIVDSIFYCCAATGILVIVWGAVILSALERIEKLLAPRGEEKKQ